MLPKVREIIIFLFVLKRRHAKSFTSPTSTTIALLHATRTVHIDIPTPCRALSFVSGRENTNDDGITVVGVEIVC